jgi:2-polyprenyl-3-methyl-5-hydroxy-6-metoxy-1,4-benzoquinol methylase
MTDRKEVEASYFRLIPHDALQKSLEKPFSIDGRASHLMEIAAVISQLPDPPMRIVDFGCGTGWTSAFFARCGYEVLGVDLATEAIEAARSYHQVPGVTFAVHDFDQPLSHELQHFGAAVFFDCLHHSEDELRPLRTAYEALDDRGVCIVCEPGKGHADSESALLASRVFGVLERDMSPQQVLAAAKVVGFAHAKVLPHPHEICRNIYLSRPRSTWRERVLASEVGEVLRLVRAITVQRRHCGLVRLTKT